MSSELLRRPAVLRALPWVAWAAAIAVAVPLAFRASGLGVAPAMVEVRKVSLTSPRALRVAEVAVVPGQAVRKGQALARLDPADLEAELAVARAELARVELEAAGKEVALTDDRAEASSRLAVESESASLEVSQLEAEDQRDRSELAQLDEQIGAQQKLVGERLASAEQLNGLKLRRAALAKKVDESGATLRQARLRAQATSRRLAEWLRGTGRDARAPEPRAQAVDPRIDRQLAPLRAAAEAQRERCRQLEVLLSRLTLTAPFDGLVGEVLALPEDVAREGQPVVSVVDAHPRSAIAYVDQRWSGRVRVGDQAVLSPSDRSGPPRTGRVVALGAAITEAPLRFRLLPTEPLFCREVFIALDEPAPLPGQAFNATFTRTEASASSRAAAAPAEGAHP